jgi:hypothetical protein
MGLIPERIVVFVRWIQRDEIEPNTCEVDRYPSDAATDGATDVFRSGTGAGRPRYPRPSVW